MRLPTYTAEQGLDSGAGTIPSTRLDTSPARALQEVGGELMQAGQRAAQNQLAMEEQQKRLAKHQEAQQKQLIEFRTDQQFQRTREQIEGEFTKLKETYTDPSGEGMTDTALGKSREKYDQFIKTVPADLQPKYSELILTAHEQNKNRYAATESGMRQNWYKSEIATRQTQLANGLGVDTSLLPASMDEMERKIDSSGIPALEKTALKQASREMFQTIAVAKDTPRLISSGELGGGQSAPVAPQDYFGPAVDVNTLPAGMRNNNPGNLKFTSRSTSLFGGVTGPSENTDQGDPQIVFQSPQAGMNAAATLALRKFNGGKATVHAIIAGDRGWTPGNDKAAANIAAGMGVGVHDRIDLSDSEQMKGFLQALVKQEHGSSSRLYDDALFDEAVRQAGANVNQGQGPTVEAAAKIPPAGPESAMAKSYLARRLTPGKASSHVDNLSDEFSSRLAAMIQAAPESVKIFSGARSIEHQKRLHDEAIRKYGRDDLPGHQVAKPGKSQHNFGNAADLEYGSPAARKWVHNNAARFGLAFPVRGEPWHVEPAEGRRGSGAQVQASPTADPVYGELHRRYPDVPFAKIMQVYDQAMTRERGALKSDADDYISFLRAGQPDTGDERFSPGNLTRILGPEEGREAARKIQDARSVGEDVAASRWTSPSEDEAMLAEREAALETPENFEESALNYGQLVTAINAKRAGLTKDPAQYVQQDEDIEAAYEKMQEGFARPGTDVRRDVDAYVDAALARQEQMGLRSDQTRILPAGAAEAMAAQFKSQPTGGQNAAAQMRGMAEQWGKHWPKVASELMPGLPATAVVVAHMWRPEQQRAAERLAELSVPETWDAVKGAASAENTKALNTALDATVADFAATLRIGSGTARFGQLYEGIARLATGYMVQDGDAPDAAAERAYRDIVEKSYAIQDGYRVPVDYEAETIGAGASAALRSIGDVRAPPSIMRFMTEPERKAEYLSALRSQGQWVTNPDESGLDLYDGQGYAVIGLDGEPVSLSWDDLVRQAAGEAEKRIRVGPFGMPAPKLPSIPQLPKLPAFPGEQLKDLSKDVLSLPGRYQKFVDSLDEPAPP